MDPTGLESISQLLANPIRLSALSGDAIRGSLENWLRRVMTDFLPEEVRLALIAQLEPDSQNLLLQIGAVARADANESMLRDMMAVGHQNALDGASIYSSILQSHNGPEPVIVVISRTEGRPPEQTSRLKIVWLVAKPLTKSRKSTLHERLTSLSGDPQLAEIVRDHCERHPKFLSNIQPALDHGAVWLVLSRTVLAEGGDLRLGAAGLTLMVDEHARPSGGLLLRVLLAARAIDSFVGTAYQVTRSSTRSETARDALSALRHSLGNRYRMRGHFSPEIRSEDHLIGLIIDGAVDIASDAPRHTEERWDELGFEGQPLHETLSTLIFRDRPRLKISVENLGHRKVRRALIPLVEELATNLASNQPRDLPGRIDVIEHPDGGTADIRVVGSISPIQVERFLTRISDLVTPSGTIAQELRGSRAILRYTRALRTPRTEVKITVSNATDSCGAISVWEGLPFGVKVSFTQPVSNEETMALKIEITELLICKTR